MDVPSLLYFYFHGVDQIYVVWTTTAQQLFIHCIRFLFTLLHYEYDPLACYVVCVYAVCFQRELFVCCWSCNVLHQWKKIVISTDSIKMWLHQRGSFYFARNLETV